MLAPTARTRRWRGLACAALASIVPLACARSPADPPLAAVVHAVRVEPSTASSSSHASGEIRARVEEALAFQMSGKVVARLVDTGDRVQAGAVLARLSAEAPRADLDVARAGVVASEAMSERTTLDVGRARLLFAQAAISRAELEASERDALVASNNLLAAKARVAIALDALSHTELRAGKGGIVTARSIEVGQVAQPGVTAFTVAEDGPRDAVFRVDEAVARRLVPGAVLSIALADAPSAVTKATVREIAPTVDPGTGSVRIKAAIEGSAADMTLGAPVVASLTLSSPSTFTVPAAAIVADEALDPAVWVFDPSTRAVTLRRVVVQTYESTRVVVQRGLAVGDLVITEGASRLRPAEVVRLAEGDPS
jgi:RND family efflux transporter MFP subunit